MSSDAASRAAVQRLTAIPSATSQLPNTSEDSQTVASHPVPRDSRLIEVGKDRRQTKLSHREQSRRQNEGPRPILNGGPLTNFDGRPISSDSSNSSVNPEDAGGAILPPKQRQSEFGRQRARQLASVVTGKALTNAPPSATLQPRDMDMLTVPEMGLTDVRISRNVDVSDVFVESIEAGNKFSFPKIHEIAVATELLPFTDPICEHDRNGQSMVAARADESSIICVSNVSVNKRIQAELQH